MNSVELQNLVKRDKILDRTFAGIFANDQLNWDVNKKPLALIANTDPSYLPGQHWVAMYFDVDGSVDYFDSYGLYPYIQEFIDFINRNSIYRNYNAKYLQSIDSSVCGIYCIYFLYHRVRRMSMNNLLDRFSTTNFLYNDKLVCNFLKKYFHYRHRVCCLKAQHCVSYRKFQNKNTI